MKEAFVIIQNGQITIDPAKLSKKTTEKPPEQEKPITCVHSAEKGACSGDINKPYVNIEYICFLTSGGISTKKTKIYLNTPETKESATYELFPKNSPYLVDIYGDALTPNNRITKITGVPGYTISINRKLKDSTGRPYITTIPIGTAIDAQSIQKLYINQTALISMNLTITKNKS